MWGKGDALEYTNPAVLGSGAYGVAMAVTARDGKRIAVEMVPMRHKFGKTAEERFAFIGRELAVMNKMRDAEARHVMTYNKAFMHENLFEACRHKKQARDLAEIYICVTFCVNVSLSVSTSGRYIALR